MQDENTFLIVRLSALGDIVMSSPLVHALRQSYPRARLLWLVQSGMEDLLAANRELDEVIVWPRSQWQQLWRQKKLLTLFREVAKFRRRLRSYHIDVAIDAQGLLKSALWAWLSGARERIGLDSREGSGLFMTRVIGKPDDSTMIGSEYRHLARQLNLPVTDFHMRVALSEADRQFAEQQINTYELQQGYVVFCPFTTRPQKHWFDQRWRALASGFHQHFNLPVVMLGGPGDEAAAAQLAQSSAIINLSGQTRLRQAAAVIARATLLVGVDTGLMHMGSAFQVPTIALFGSTCPYTETDSRKTVVIYHQLDCSPCRRRPTCHGEYTCMKLITDDEILAVARRLLADRSVHESTAC